MQEVMLMIAQRQGMMPEEGEDATQLTGVTACAAGRASRRTVRKPGRSSPR